MVSKIFKNNATQTQKNEFVRIEGPNSPIILAGPHNGKHVPGFLYHDEKPLGLSHGYMEHRHEASDLYAQELFETIWEKAPYVRTISGRLSRLVIDLNRVSNRIPETSSDTGDIIPGNLGLSKEDIKWRKEQYNDYHEEKCKLISEARKEFGQTIYLDIHTFNRKFKEEERSVDIGTFKPKESKLSNLMEESLKKHAGTNFKFEPDAPYDTSEETDHGKTNAGKRIAEKTNVDFLGIEICNDLLDTQEKRDQIAEILLKALHEILPKYDLENTVSIKKKSPQKHTTYETSSPAAGH